jgi:hypothetical protein
MQLQMSEQDALTLCTKQKLDVSAIERLPQGGVRLVCSSRHGADTIRKKAKSKIIKIEQAREKHRPASPTW